ncbi:hypothetical protein FBY35_4414 [Streptomyces sp. SLBN-118]|uniref:DUF6777 domain-containing protein n=1 Tax=Streptomyces sp. SLBN-118 TaxID=2768454 RepID=UPI00116FD7AD|nr:DUF6777 domain-containing protein [Streptomyces sp. SLBN-118]TQK42967.1 hypothetical protein FBY35_4414 [Streptomyces sp. SLBN-118]
MSAQPPSSDRPTGPPSGPLSGPTQQTPTPPPGTPPGPPTGGGGGGPGGPGGGGGQAQGPGPEPERPWWRSVPRIATVAAVLVAVVALTLVLTRPGGGGTAAAGEIVRDPVNAAGEDPYTPSSADKEPPPKDPLAPPEGKVTGSDAGVYGGTRKTASCNVEKQISYLAAAPAKNSAFASVLGISPDQVPRYLRSLTPLRLSYDTRVTNHGYKDGGPTSYQSVLQAGTAVLVDDHGVPRVRCACGNPLQEPKKVQGDARLTGPTWSGFRTTKVVQVQPSVTVINVFVVYDPRRGDWFERKSGDHGRHDKKVPAPVTLPPTSPSPCPPTGHPSPGSSSPCPPTSPSSKPPSPESPSSEPPSSEPPSSEPPSSEQPESGASSPESPSGSSASQPDAASSSTLAPGL